MHEACLHAIHGFARFRVSGAQHLRVDAKRALSVQHERLLLFRKSLRRLGGALLAVLAFMTFNNILVATDFSDCAEHALNLGVELAQKFGAQLTLVHAWEFPYSLAAGLAYSRADLISGIEKETQRELTKACEALKLRYPSAKAVLRTGVPWQEIITAAQVAEADLIVVGTHGRTGISRALMGSVAERVVRLAPVPVLTVHGPAVKSAAAP
jgi:nucleotide-binding universal stress UspA family protein